MAVAQLNLCVQEQIDRTNPDHAKYLSLETTEVAKRICRNSRIAPHNLEGLFLIWGTCRSSQDD